MVGVDVADSGVVVVVVGVALLKVLVEHVSGCRSGRSTVVLLVSVNCTLDWCRVCVVAAAVCPCFCPCPWCCSVTVFVVVVVRTVRASRMMRVVTMLVDFAGINMLVVSNCGGY